MNPGTRTRPGRIPLSALVLVAALSFAGRAWALYPPDGTKPNGSGGYMNPGDGVCVIGIKQDGTMLVDWSITNYRDCVAWTRSADGSVNLVGLDSQDKCTKAGFAGNDGYKHAWSTSLCYDGTNSRGISRVDLDNTDSMCFSRGGTVVTSGKCVAYGWVYNNRKADNTLPVSGTGIATTDGVQFTDNLGFCYTAMRMTGGTYTSTTCPSRHNSRASADPVGGPYVEWPDCLSSTTGCQSQASYDAGLGWSFASSNCVYAYGVNGTTNASVTRADGSTIAAGTLVDTRVYTNQGDCLANGFLWDNWLPVSGTVTRSAADGGDYAGMPAGAVIRKLDGLTAIDDGGGAFYSGTGAVCQKCHSDQSRSYMERDKPGFPATRHKLAGDASGKPFQTHFTSANSEWGLQGVQCAMCHSTAKPAQDDLIQVVPAGAPGEGNPKSASGHNQTEYGSHLIDICYTCHATAATPLTTNPASVIPSSPSDFVLTGKGLPPIANQFLNSPHAKYAGSSSKVDVGNKTKYGSSFEGYVCRTAATQFRNNAAPGDTQANCTAAGHTWYTTGAPYGNFCYYNATSCTALPGQWLTSFSATAYPWAAVAGGPGAVCVGVGTGSIITTVYRNGEAEKIPNLDTLANTACTNPGDGSATSGAAGFWLKDGELSPGGNPVDTAQGNCMTCHDVHWALADTAPEAEPLRRECTTCHSHPTGEASASSAPQIDLATINHLGGAGTPLANMSTHPDEACETCHMPRSATGASPMHLWRINTDPAYLTLGATKANLAPDGAYTNAAWVDLEHACGQCHGPNRVGHADAPLISNTRLALVARGIHEAAGLNCSVTFSTSQSSLTVNVVPSVNCGAAPVDLRYDWDWGDGSPDGTLQFDSHAYATGGTKTIALTVTDHASGDRVVGSSTRNVTIANPDLPPTIGGTCVTGTIGSGLTWDANHWIMRIEDLSTDDGPDADTAAEPGANPSLQISLDWGDGSTRSYGSGSQAAVFTHVYTRAGTFAINETAVDSAVHGVSQRCVTDATPQPFTILGTVKTNGGVAPVAGATVQIKLQATGVIVKTTTTASNGQFSSGAVLKPGVYSLVAIKPGYNFPVASVGVGPSSPNYTDTTINATAGGSGPTDDGPGEQLPGRKNTKIAPRF